VKNVTRGNPLTVEQLQDCLDLAKPQLGLWLKRAVSEGQLEKLGKPVRYRWRGTPMRQPAMLGDDNFVGVQRGMEAEE
jgi:hypothetical protein